MRAAIYARYSSDQQRAASIEDQIRLCTEQLERIGADLVQPYTDYALSGATLNRPGIQSLLQDCQSGKIDVVVAEALDRLSRDQEDVAGIFKRLTFQNVRLVTLSEGEISELHVGLKGTMNSLFLKDLAAKTRRGLRGRVEQGKSGGGNSFGYDVVTTLAADGTPIHGERAINPDEATTVVTIFERYARGDSPRAIAQQLNHDAIPGPSGRTWGPSTINGNAARGTGILNNELYIGRLVWNRLHYVKDPETGKRISRLNPTSEWIVKEVPALRIVPQDLWDKVKVRQASIKKPRDAATEIPFWDRRRPRYLFSGLIKCGCCGGGFSMIGQSLLGCSTARNKGTCDNRLTIRRDILEATVLDGLRHHLMAPDLFEEFCTEFTHELNRLRRDALTARARMERELQSVERGIRRIIDAIKDGVPALSIKDEMIALEARKQDLTARLQSAPEEKPLIHPNMAKLYRRKVADLTEALAGEDTRSEACELIRALVEAIVLVPVDGELKVELRGDLASILQLCSNGKRPGPMDRAFAEQFKLVAGRGFEPLTFRL